MDKENGEANDSATGSSSKMSNSAEQSVGAGLLDAASLFGAYWPRTDAQSPANAASLFAAVAAGGGGAGAYGAAHPALGPHHPAAAAGLPFGLLPPAAAAAAAAAAASSSRSGPSVSAYSQAVSSSAYTNTLSVAASQAASLGLNPAASAAWWSMASQLAAQDYLARLQASGLSFPSLTGSPTDPYAALGLPSLASMHKSSKSSSSSKNSNNGSSMSSKSSSKSRTSATALSLQAGAKLDGRLDPSYSSKNPSYLQRSSQKMPVNKTSSGLTIQPSNKPVSSSSSSSSTSLTSVQKKPSLPSPSGKSDSSRSDYKPQSVPMPKSSTPKSTQSTTTTTSQSIFTSPLSLASSGERSTPERTVCTTPGGTSTSQNTMTTQSLVNSGIASSIPPNILSWLDSELYQSAALEGSDPNSILGGVRLPPDTEIIKYTSSIVGPKIPGTTNRGRKKTISLDPPSDPHELSSMNDRVEVIKLPATNGSPSGLNIPGVGNSTPNSESSGADAPLNLSLKPASTSSSNTNCNSNSLNSLSNLSANIGVDRISRRKPGPKPRRVIQSPSHLLNSSTSIPSAPSASLAQLFAAADSPRPPSRNDDTDSVTSNTSTPTATPTPTTQVSQHSTQNHKDGRPRNLGRGVSKPKKNTVASLLAQSRALGIKPVQIDPNTPMNQQMSLLKSNILAAQQYMAEQTGNEQHLEKIRNALSDSSNMEVSTDSDNLTDSNQTDSEAETDANGLSNPKKRRHYNERDLRIPLEHGWKRETIIRGLTKSGGIRGDVYYTPPNTNNKLKQWSEVLMHLEQTGKSTELTRDNFTFSCKLILGDYLQKPPPGVTSEGEYLRMSEDDVNKRLEELKSLTRSNLAVEQRIEVARRQQAARAAARLDREQARLAREIERNEKQEAARRDREARTQQLMEGRKRLAFTLEQKMQIINEIEGGKTKSDVSRQLGLASSTVATIWKNRDNILNAYGGGGGDFLSLPSDEPLAKLKECLPPDVNTPSPSKILDISPMARRKRHEDLSRQRQEEQQRKIQEREIKKQQAAMIKEQMYIQEMTKQREILFSVELEREKRRQHMALVKALEARRRLEERERKKQQALLEKQASKERRMEQRRIDMEILAELRKPCEDLELTQKPLPEYPRIPGLRLSGQAFSDILMVFEFLHNFGETLGFDMESLPCLASLQQALLNESLEAEEELLSVMTHLLVCAIEDPGIPNPARHTTILGQSLRQADITHANISEILRIYLYANATGEVKALTGVHFERDREKRIADHHQSGNEMAVTQGGKNAAYYELLHENSTWRMSDSLKDKPFLALNPTEKAAMLAFLCNELLQNKAVIRQIDGSLENVAQLRKERWLLDTKIRKVRMSLSRKQRAEAAEKAQLAQAKLESGETNTTENGETPATVDSPALPHKDVDLLDEEEDISENESEGTQPEEEEDKKLSSEELNKKLDKLLKMSEDQLRQLNASAHQLRATCYGQDRYWRRYWSLPTAGGIFVEAMESASPEVLVEQEKTSENTALGINSVEDIKRIIHDSDTINDPNVDNEVSKIINEGEKEQEQNTNEHRKTPNRVKDEPMEVDENVKVENEVTEVKKEVDSEEKKPKIGLFEKLGECMEKENNKNNEIKEVKLEEVKEEKVEVKEEKPVKMEVDEEKSLTENGHKWFSILHRDGLTCEGVHLTSGNRWDTGIICTRENYGAELKIPVFPPPNCQNNYMSCTSCDSPGPLQMTAEESVQLEFIKANGPPQCCDLAVVPPDKRYGWWRITDCEQLKEVLDGLHMRGARERELKRCFQSTMQSMYESAARIEIEEGNTTATDLTVPPQGQELEGSMSVVMEHNAAVPDKPGWMNTAVAERVDLCVLEQVEALEDKVANASMQVKGWKIPNREAEEVPPGLAVALAKERLAALEGAIERRYLKPPLGVRSVVMIENTGDALNTSNQNNHNVSNQDPTGNGSQPNNPGSSNTETVPKITTGGNNVPDVDAIPKGLTVWRDAVQRSNTSAQLAMCLYMLEASIAWDKSIMKANCQFCHSGDNEDKLLLCDSCDKGYHTYCFKPKMETIPEGNWYCYECINKVTGERNCIVCGKKQSTGRLMLCDLCPRAYHQDCIQPALTKVPRGKWYCPNCHSKQPKKRNSRRSNNKPTRDSESSDHPPASPAPSHSSVTTNEDLTNQSTVSQQTPSKNSNDITNSTHTQLNNSNSGQQSTSSSPGGSTAPPRKERVSKKLQKELAPCKVLLEDLESHDDAWPFLIPVNTKQFPTYKKIITSPMDLSTIKKRLNDLQYKSREEFCMDVRQIFDNCETFNEDDSPVGKAGHCMRQFFEARWNELCAPYAGKS